MLLVAATLGCRGEAPRPLLRPGHYLYVPSFTRGGIFGFRLNEQTGTIAPLHVGRYLPGYVAARQLVFAPSGSFGFLRTAVEVVAFSVGADGALDLLPTRIPSTGRMALHPSGRLLFTVSAPSTINSYRLGEDGVPSAPLAYTSKSVVADLMFDAQGDRLYALGDQPPRFLVFNLDQTTGALTETTGSPENLSNPGGQRVARVHPSGRFLFLLNEGYQGSMHVFLRAADGYAPAIGSPFVLGRSARTFTIDPTGRFLFVVHTQTHQISAYALDDVGALHPVPGSPVNVAGGPESVEVDPTGRFLYVAYPSAMTISVLAIDRTSGALTPISGSTAAGGPEPRDMFFVAMPRPQVEIASLPFMDPSLLPVQTTSPDERPAASQQVLPPTLRRDPSPPPPQPAILACGVPSAATGYVSNLERVPFQVTLFGDVTLRPQVLRFGPGGDAAVGVIELAATTAAIQPVALPIKVTVTGGESDSYSTRMSMLIEVPVPESYVTSSVDDYLNALLSGRVTRPGGNDDTLQLLRRDRATAAAAMRTLFFENRQGPVDVVCTYKPPARGPGTPLTAKARFNVVSRGRFFDQATFVGR